MIWHLPSHILSPQFERFIILFHRLIIRLNIDDNRESFQAYRLVISIVSIHTFHSYRKCLMALRNALFYYTDLPSTYVHARNWLNFARNKNSLWFNETFILRGVTPILIFTITPVSVDFNSLVFVKLSTTKFINTVDSIMFIHWHITISVFKVIVDRLITMYLLSHLSIYVLKVISFSISIATSSVNNALS